jgi:hypothetical protein
MTAAVTSLELARLWNQSGSPRKAQRELDHALDLLGEVRASL